MRKLYSLKLAAVALTAFGSMGVSVPVASADTPFDQCLRDHCFGNFPGDPAGYRACWVWCADTYGGPE